MGTEARGAEARAPRDALLDRCVEWFAANGIGDISMRGLAAEIGTSQRMLHYHFGSREDLLAAVVERVVGTDTVTVDAVPHDPDDPLAGWESHWARIADNAEWLGGLFFEVSAHAMYGQPHARRLRAVLVDDPLRVFTAMLEPRVGRVRADELARLSMATGRGAIFQLLLDGDRTGADRTMATLVALIRSDPTMG